MKKRLFIFAAITLSVLLGSYLGRAQQPAQEGRGGGRGAQAPPQPMSFFITSAGKGDGANLGGLAGADAQACQVTLPRPAAAASIWQNSAHPSRGCSQENLVSTGGAGLFYCFSVNRPDACRETLKPHQVARAHA